MEVDLMLERRVPRFVEHLQYPTWQPDCEAAILEANPVKLKEKIAAAEAAIFNRAQKLISPDDDLERGAMDEASNSLRAILIAVLGYPDSRK
jgi:hypothetical protein